MAKTITSANAIIVLSIPVVFPAPQRIQGFSADDIFGTDQIDSAEVMMGLDGYLSAGFVFQPIKQNYTLQADSDSNDVFDQWWQAQQNLRDAIECQGNISLVSIGKKYALTRGFLTGYPPAPDGGKTLKPRKYTITWNEINGANV